MVKWGDERRMSPEVVDPEPPPPSPPAEDWGARVDELLAQAEAAPPGSPRALLLCRVAEIYERRLGDPGGALLTLQAALEEDPASGRVIQEMERVARGNGVWSQLVGATAEVAGNLHDRKQAADLWGQIAFWSESGLARLDEAATAARSCCSRSCIGGSAARIAMSRSWRASASGPASISARWPMPIGRCCA